MPLPYTNARLRAIVVWKGHPLAGALVRKEHVFRVTLTPMELAPVMLLTARHASTNPAILILMRMGDPCGLPVCLYLQKYLLLTH